MQWWFMGAVMVLLTACAAAGVQITENQLKALQKGKTTYNEVVQRFGMPSSTILNPDGTRTIAYVYSEAQTRPETFIPIVGAFVGGMDTRSNIVSLTFDHSANLLNYTSSSSQIGASMGFAAGDTGGRVVDQPRQEK